jgi:hypothetical protein
MKTIVLVAGILVTTRVCAATIGPRLGVGEAPRATDLLRAETLAERAERRLRLPHAASRGWVKGGTGWGAEARPPGDAAPVINIRVKPPSKRRPLE